MQTNDPYADSIEFYKVQLMDLKEELKKFKEDHENVLNELADLKSRIKQTNSDLNKALFDFYNNH